MRHRRDLLLLYLETAIVLGVFVFLYLLIQGDGPIGMFDRFVYGIIPDYRSPVLNLFFIFFTYLGSGYSVFALSVVLVLALFAKKADRSALIYSVSMIAVGFFTFAFKNFGVRLRPDTWFFPETGYSFPSGHAAIAVAFYLLLYLLSRDFSSVVSVRRIFGAMVFILPVLIGLSRVYLGVHFVSDIIGGYLLGLCLSLPAIALWKKRSV